MRLNPKTYFKKMMSPKPFIENEEWLRHFQNITIHTDEIRGLGLVLVVNINFFSVRVIIVILLMKITHFDYEFF